MAPPHACDQPCAVNGQKTRPFVEAGMKPDFELYLHVLLAPVDVGGADMTMQLECRARGKHQVLGAISERRRDDSDEGIHPPINRCRVGAFGAIRRTWVTSLDYRKSGRRARCYRRDTVR